MNGRNPIVFIIDDDALVRASLTNLCRSVDLDAQAFGSTDEFLRAQPPDVPACLVLDVRFPGSAPSGLDFQRQLVEANNPLPIIFVTGHGDVPMSVQAMKHGAVEFLLKPVREQALLDAIRQAIARDRQRRERNAVSMSLRNRYASLTAREREIMYFVTRGLLNKQISTEVGLSEVTVKVHRARAMQKMEARSVAELVRMVDQLSEPAAQITQPDTEV
jgi:FixJ family two-component response regulator